MGRGRESLVKWNLVTDASEGGAALQGRVEEVVCLCVRGRPRVLLRARGRVRVSHLCVQARAGKGQDMSAH